MFITQFLVISSLITATRAFLLDTNSSFTALTSTEFNQLLDLVLKEQKARYQLEHYVGILENRFRDIEKSVHNLTAANNELRVRNEELENKVLNLNATVKEMRDHGNSSELNKNLTAADHLGTKGQAQIGFTVKHPDMVSYTNSSTVLTFRTESYNSNPGINRTSGKFVCQHPGMYLFTATITRLRLQESDASCYIIVNDIHSWRTVLVMGNNGNNATGASNGYPSGSNTLITHLDRGDEVFMSLCMGINEMHYETSFSGVLLQPDIL